VVRGVSIIPLEVLSCWRGVALGWFVGGYVFFFCLFLRSCDDLTSVNHLDIVGFISTSLAFPMSAMDQA
jgi:hypothetical protein